jgi:hypothetical protein
MKYLGYNPGKCGNNPIGFRPKEDQLIQKKKASRGVFFFVSCPGLY